VLKKIDSGESKKTILHRKGSWAERLLLVVVAISKGSGKSLGLGPARLGNILTIVRS
jgi:hypothetical protein